MVQEVHAGESPSDHRVDHAPTVDELLDEVAVVIEDASRFHADEDINESAAFMAAQLAASVRDFDRRSIGLGDLATLFAGWLINSAHRDAVDDDSLEAARCAVAGSAEFASLARQLREFVEAYATGAMDAEELTRRLTESESR
jgi:hypothetical protein